MQKTPKSMQVRAARNAGFNLIEAAIVLGIVGLIVGGIWAAAGSAYENMRLQNASKQLLAFVQGIRGAFAQDPSSATIDIPTLVGLGVVPTDMLVRGTGGAADSIVHQWGGTVTPADASAGGIPMFSLTYDNVKQDSCNNLATRVGNAGRGSGLIKITTGGGDYIDLSTDAGAPAKAGGPACTAPSDNVVFIFTTRG